MYGTDGASGLGHFLRVTSFREVTFYFMKTFYWTWLNSQSDWKCGVPARSGVH